MVLTVYKLRHPFQLPHLSLINVILNWQIRRPVCHLELARDIDIDISVTTIRDKRRLR